MWIPFNSFFFRASLHTFPALLFRHFRHSAHTAPFPSKSRLMATPTLIHTPSSCPSPPSPPSPAAKSPESKSFRLTYLGLTRAVLSGCANAVAAPSPKSPDSSPCQSEDQPSLSVNVLKVINPNILLCVSAPRPEGPTCLRLLVGCWNTESFPQLNVPSLHQTVASEVLSSCPGC